MLHQVNSLLIILICNFDNQFTVDFFLSCSVIFCSYDYKREYQLGLKTTIPVKNCTASEITYHLHVAI